MLWLTYPCTTTSKSTCTCIYIYIYIYVYVCVCVYMCLHVQYSLDCCCVCIHSSAHNFTCTIARLCATASMCYSGRYVFMRSLNSLCVHVLVCMYMCVCVYVYMCACVHVCMCRNLCMINILHITLLLGCVHPLVKSICELSCVRHMLPCVNSRCPSIL